jgi:gluconokinase
MHKLETACVITIVMGVTGAGKTTVGSLLARQLGWEFVDGDSFHPPSNIEKMSRGIPLTDADRLPWLQVIYDAILEWRAEVRNVVLACSALKRRYRDLLLVAPDVKLIYLKGDYELIRNRLLSRHGHFATEQLLAGQFADLEEPDRAIVVDAGGTPEEIVSDILVRLRV